MEPAFNLPSPHHNSVMPEAAAVPRSPTSSRFRTFLSANWKVIAIAAVAILVIAGVAVTISVMALCPPLIVTGVACGLVLGISAGVAFHLRKRYLAIPSFPI